MILTARMMDVGLLDLFAMGVVALDAEGRVRAVNQRAWLVVGAGDRIDLSGERIVLARREDAAALARLLDGARSDHHAVDGLHVRGALQIARGADAPKLTLLVAHVRGWPIAPPIAFIVFLHASDAEVVVSEPILRTLHGLTLTEARIAALLVRGHGVAAIATAMGSSTNTVRTHLKRAFAKLEVTSQSMLIRAVLSGPAALPLESDGQLVRARSRAARIGH